MFSKEIKCAYINEIASKEIKKKLIRKRECLYLGIDLFMNTNPPQDASNEVFLYFCFLKIFVFFVVIIIIVLPYYIQIIPIIIFGYSFETGNVLFILTSFFNMFFSLFSFLGSLGYFVECCCGQHCCICLYHPSNWVLFVVLIDLVNLILDNIIGIFGEKESIEFSYSYLAFLHIPIIFYNLFRQISLYVEFKKAYKSIRKAETDVIKECIKELLKERNYYNE